MENLTQIVLTTNEILEGSEIITEIYHDEDDTWQALSENPILNDPKVISVENLIELDNSIKDILPLINKGKKATLTNSKWVITQNG